MKKKVVTFGEPLIRLALEDFNPILRHTLKGFNPITGSYVGSEVNVASAIASYGMSTSFVSKLPDNLVGRNCYEELKSKNIDTGCLELVSYGRMGIYFYENKIKRTCDYDRQGSSISMSKPEDYNWEKILDGAKLFHFSGITPALSKNLQVCCENALTEARKKNIIISCDINYRDKLWDKSTASKVMSKLCKSADILFINEDEASILGFETKGDSMINADNYAGLVKYLRDSEYKAQTITTVARVPLDDTGALGVKAIIWHKGKISMSKTYQLINVIDPNGAGDAYAAAVIYSLLSGKTSEEAVNLGAAAAWCKHGYWGDINLATWNRIEEISRI